jgi:hypothetical protein
VAPVLDDKETVQQLKCQSRHSEEIEGNDDLPVVLGKRQPRFTCVVPASHATQIPGDSPLRNNEPELQQLAVDLRSSTIRVLSRQALDQSANPLGNLGSAAAWPASPAPIETEAARCQSTTVSGFTRTRTSDQRDQHWPSIVQKSRSQGFSFGRGRFRFSTATCWRRARTSRAVSLRLRKKTRMATKKERMISSTKHPFNTP